MLAGNQDVFCTLDTDEYSDYKTLHVYHAHQASIPLMGIQCMEHNRYALKAS
jgi:hypothetical protein